MIPSDWHDNNYLQGLSDHRQDGNGEVHRLYKYIQEAQYVHHDLYWYYSCTYVFEVLKHLMFIHVIHVPPGGHTGNSC